VNAPDSPARSVPLPVLYSIRVWLQEVNPAYITFVEEMRDTGVDVVDIYVPPAGFRTFGEWAIAVVEAIDSHRHDDEPLHLIGYCLGGVIMLVVIAEFERRAISPACVSMIDARMYSQDFRFRRGFDSVYQTPWPVRLRGLLIRLTPPDRESFGSVAPAVLRRSIRSVRELPKRGWRSRKRRIPAVHEEQALAFAWELDSISTPVYCYNTQASIDLYAPNDPSLHMGRYLQGGYVVRMIEGNHENCIDTPYATSLIEKITADRIAVVQGVGAFE
jgi:thioesterase domain-containing protein